MTIYNIYVYVNIILYSVNNIIILITIKSSTKIGYYTEIAVINLLKDLWERVWLILHVACEVRHKKSALWHDYNTFQYISISKFIIIYINLFVYEKRKYNIKGKYIEDCNEAFQTLLKFHHAVSFNLIDVVPIMLVPIFNLLIWKKIFYTIFRVFC